jgi:hypothetical protein
VVPPGPDLLPQVVSDLQVRGSRVGEVGCWHGISLDQIPHLAKAC